MDAADRRFGFSVVGGQGDGVSARVDHVQPGSPADKADLEVGDEILEVNGRSLEDASHTEVISHIHQCIRSRTICLRVKRRSGNRLGEYQHWTVRQQRRQSCVKVHPLQTLSCKSQERVLAAMQCYR
ncbi:whirlin-like [Schistocerca cancellata]|uniref:whirlin-like n=1 Tax=Schistocerca cancellata TaxID=274614 RepID=UPI0021180E53|nr:whirlin-like [Schistocerca cancellata]